MTVPSDAPPAFSGRKPKTGPTCAASGLRVAFARTGAVWTHALFVDR